MRYILFLCVPIPRYERSWSYIHLRWRCKLPYYNHSQEIGYQGEFHRTFFQLAIAYNSLRLLYVSQKCIYLRSTEIRSSLSLDQISFHILFEPDNAQLYYRCHLQLPVKSTYLMLIFCFLIQE